MVDEYSHLFFYYYECEERGDLQEAERISQEKNYLIKELKVIGYDVGELVESLKTKKAFQNEFQTVILFSDGGVRNNHDPLQKSMAASAFVVYGDQHMLKHESAWIGDSITLPTGECVNVNSTLAEYHGLLKALLFCEKHQIKSKQVIFLTDCATMVQHVTKKVPSHPMLKDFAQDLRDRLNTLSNVEVKYIPREHNKVADTLVNQLMDEYERREMCATN